MAKTASINVRTEPDIKKRAEELFGSFGITVSDAINIFLHVSLMKGGLPFDMQKLEEDLVQKKALEKLTTNQPSMDDRLLNS